MTLAIELFTHKVHGGMYRLLRFDYKYSLVGINKPIQSAVTFDTYNKMIADFDPVIVRDRLKTIEKKKRSEVIMSKTESTTLYEMINDLDKYDVEQLTVILTIRSTRPTRDNLRRIMSESSHLIEKSDVFKCIHRNENGVWLDPKDSMIKRSVRTRILLTLKRVGEK